MLDTELQPRSTDNHKVTAFKVRCGCEGGGKGYLGSEELAMTISTTHDQDIFIECYPLNTQIITRGEAMGEGTGFGMGENGEPAYRLQAAHSHAVACFKGGQGSAAGGIGYSEVVAPTLPSDAGGNSVPTLMQHMQVRRLTPTECERLQGFPDGYTNIPWRNKEESPDGPRYKALGNSMCTNVMLWIGQRIDMVSKISG